MNKRVVALLCGFVFIAGIVVGWVIHSRTFEPQLVEYQSELTELKEHSALRLTYDPYNRPRYYDVGGVFKVELTVLHEWGQIVGNVTNLTDKSINCVCLICIPRYPDNSLDVETFMHHDEIELLSVGQAKDFLLIATDLEENQPFDLLLIY